MCDILVIEFDSVLGNTRGAPDLAVLAMWSWRRAEAELVG